MTRLEQARDQVASTSDSGNTTLQEYRLGAQKTPVDKTQAATAVAAEPKGYTDAGSSATNQIIGHWHPDHGQSKSGKAWFKAMKAQEPVPVAGNYYKVQDGDCLESIARRELRTEKQKVDTKSTNAGVEKLIELNKGHYKSLTVNEHYIQKGWTLKLSEADLAGATETTAATKPAESPVPVVAPDAAAAVATDKPKTAPGDPSINGGKPDVVAPTEVKAPEVKAPDTKASDKPPPPAEKAPAPAPTSSYEVPPPKSPGLMDQLYSYGKEACDEGKQLYHDHKWLIGGAALVGTAALLVASRGRISKLLGAEKEIGATAQTIERDAVLAKVGAIPDVERPQITSLIGFDADAKAAQFETAATGYRSSLAKLTELPTHYTIGEEETVPGLAKRVLEERAPITGERITPESIETEATRIRALNPTIDQAVGDPLVVVHDGPAISKLAETTRFKHVPQIGQLLKQHGVSEDNIQDAFKLQNSLPKENRPLIGQILVDEKLATKEQVDNAFEHQNSLKAMLKDVQTEVLGKPN
jgi:LysM repeat protein